MPLARVHIEDHDVVRREGEAPAVGHDRGLSRISPLDRLQRQRRRAWLRGRARLRRRRGLRWGQVGLGPCGEIRRTAPLVRRDDHECEQAGAGRANRTYGGIAARRRGRARDVGDVESQVEAGRRRAGLRTLGIPPGPGVAEAPTNLIVRERVVARRTFQIASNLSYAWHGVSVRAWLARGKRQREKRDGDGRSLRGGHHRRLIVSDRVGQTTPALLETNPNVSRRGISVRKGGFANGYAQKT